MAANVVVPLNNTDIINRLVSKSIITDLMFATRIDDIKNIIYIPRGSIAAQSQYLNEDETLKLASENYIQVEYKQIIDPTEFDFTKYQFEHAPVFKASELGVSITPLHSRIQLELDITFYNKSYNVLQAWIDNFRYLNIKENSDLYHDIEYHYAVPDDVVTYLNQVYQLQESVAGYGITLQDFIKQNSIPTGIGIRQNMIGTEHTLTIHVKNTGCLGIYNSSISDEPETSHEPPQSWVTFTYIVTYDRPMAVLLQYQKYIHNQVIDLEYIYKYADRRLHVDPHRGAKTFSQTVNQVSDYSNRYMNTGYVKDGYINGDNKQYLTFGGLAYGDNAINITDGWIPDTTPANMLISNVFPIQLDLTNLYSVMDLNLLNLLDYPEWLIPILKDNKDLLTQLYKWVFYIEVYEVNSETNRIPILIDDNFHLLSTIQLNPRNRYYVRILINTDLMNVDFNVLQKQPDSLRNLLQYVNPKVKLKTIGNNSFVTNNSLWEAKNLIHDMCMKPFSNKLVQTTTIVVQRKDN